MANLRTKYFSKNLQAWVELNTSKNVSLNSNDILKTGSADLNIESKRIRLVPFNDDLDSTDLMELIADLIYNDIQAYNQAAFLGNTMSDGVYKNVKNSFDIEVLDVSNIPAPLGQVYINSFAIKDGMACKNQETNIYEPPFRIKQIQIIAPLSNLQIAVDNSLDLEVGMVITSPLFPKGTEITNIVSPTLIEISKQPTGLPVGFVPVSFEKKAVFKIGREIDELTLGFVGYRRDLIEFNIKNSTFNVVKGREGIVKPPINSNLDSLYVIKTIEHNGVLDSNIFRVYLRATADRILTEDFEINEEIRLIKTISKEWDGYYTITDISNDSNNPWVEVIAIGKTEDTFNQVEEGGYLETNYLPLYSVLIERNSSGDPTIIVDSIDRIFDHVGIDSSIDEIYRATIEQDEFGIFGLHTKNKIHLTDPFGRWLEWKAGQSATEGSIGYKYNEIEIEGASKIDNTQLPFTPYDVINNFSLTNIPFILRDLQDNIFGESTVELNNINLAMKNTIRTIGDESIEIKLVSGDVVEVGGLEELQVSNGGLNNIEVITSGDDLTTKGLIANEDFILVTDGPGSYQIGKITLVASQILTVSGLLKPLTTLSKIVIFRNSSITDVPNSETSLTNAQIRTQVISGANGTFYQNEFSKVQFEYNNGIFLNLNKWYFIQTRAKQEGATWGNSPYIAIQKTDSGERQSAFIEILYKTVEQGYPNESLVIEDELGDLTIPNPARTIAPHFRPSFYEFFAKPIDVRYLTNADFPTKINQVFVDVQSGRILFNEKGTPRKVFVSYFKKDILSGDSSDFSLKHIDKDETKQINIQDKFTDIDNKFTKGGSFEKTIEVNGIIQKPVKGFRGPFSVSNRNPFEINYILDSYDNHFVEKTKNNIKLNILNEYNIIHTKDHSILISDKISDSLSNFNGNLIVGYMNTIVPKPSFNAENKLIAPVQEIFDFQSLYFKPWNSALFPTEIDFSNDTKIINPLASVSQDGTWNDFNSSTFDNFNVLKMLIRKSYTENLPYVADLETKRKWKQRFVVKNTDSFLANYGGSEAQIISERYMTEIKFDKDGIEHKGENLVFPFTQSTKFTNYELQLTDAVSMNDVTLRTQLDELEFNNLIVDNILYSCIRTNDNIPATIDHPTYPTFHLHVRKYLLNKDNNEVEINEFTDTILQLEEYRTDFPILEMKAIEFDDRLIAIAMLRNVLGVNRIQIQFLDKVTLEPLLESNSLVELAINVSGLAFFDFKKIKTNTMAVAYRFSNTQSFFNIVSFDPEDNNFFTVSDDYTLVLAEDVLEQINICKFSRNSFLINYTTSLGSRIKRYTTDGIAEFFDEAETIDEYIITNLVPTTGTKTYLLETLNNDLAVVYQHQSDVNDIQTKMAIFDEWDFNKKEENVLFTETVGSISSEYQIINLNEDVIIFKRKKDDDIIFETYLSDIRFNKKLTIQYLNTDKTNILSTTENSFSFFRRENLNDLKLSLIEYRPDFTNEFILDTNTNESFTEPYKIAANVAINNNKMVTVGHKDNHLAIVIQTINGDGEIIVDYQNDFVIEFNNILSGIEETALKVLDVQHINYLGNALEVNNLVISAVPISSNKLYVFVFDLNTLALNVSTGIQYTALAGSGDPITNLVVKKISKDVLFFIGNANTSENIKIATADFDNRMDSNVYEFNHAQTVGLLADNNLKNLALSNITSPFSYTSYFVKNNKLFLSRTTMTDTILNTYDIVKTISSNPVVYEFNVSEEQSLHNAQTVSDIVELENSIALVYRIANDLFYKVFDYTYTFLQGDATTGIPLQSNVDDVHNRIVQFTGKQSINLIYKNIIDTETYVRNILFTDVGIIESADFLIPVVSYLRFNVIQKQDGKAVLFRYIWLSEYSIQSFDISPLSISILTDAVIDEGSELFSYLSSSIKVTGNNFIGKKLPVFNVFTNKSRKTIPGLYETQIHDLPYSIVKINENNFTIVYQDLEDTGKVFMRDFTVIDGRFFADSELYEFDFFDLQSTNNTYIEAFRNEENLIYFFKNPDTNNINILKVDLFANPIDPQTTITIDELENPEIIFIKQLIENKYLMILKSMNMYYTYLIDENLKVLNEPQGFMIEEFIDAEKISKPNADSFANIVWYYKKNGDLNYKIHGIDGKNFGICQVVGKWNYLVV